MNYSKKVLLTGGTGLIGKESIKPLQDLGFEIFAISSKKHEINKNIHWIECNLFDSSSVDKIFREVKPSHLLHFAWTTESGNLTNPINNDYVEASMHLLKEFAKNGGQRAVYAGTCFEYKLGQTTPLKETDEISPNTLYSECKNNLHTMAQDYSKTHEISFAWGRIFYVYGHAENPHRLVGNIISSIKNSTQLVIKTPNLIKDYLYTKDIGLAFSNLLDSKIENSINICSGKGTKVIDLVNEFLTQANAQNLLKIEETTINQPQIIIGENSRLKEELGFQYKYNLKQAVSNILKDSI